MKSRDVIECRDAELAKFLIQELGDMEVAKELQDVIKQVWTEAWRRGVEFGYEYAKEVAIDAMRR